MVALTRTEAIARIQQGLGWRADKSAEILLELRLKQSELEKGQSLPWWLRTDGSLTGTANVATLTVPTGFIRFDEETALRFDDDPNDEVALVDYDDLLLLGVDDATGEAETGAARWIAIRQSTFIVRPIPTASFTINGSWYVVDTDLANVAAGASNQWLTYAPLVLIGLAGESMAMDLDYLESAARFQKMYQDANSRLIADIVLRQYSGRDYQIGSAQ